MFFKLPMLFVSSEFTEDQINEFIQDTLQTGIQDDGDSLTFFVEIEQPLCLPTSP
jgi:hypothetical protein